MKNLLIKEIENLSIQNDFNILNYYFKVESAIQNFVGFKDPLGFHKNIKDVYIKVKK